MRTTVNKEILYGVKFYFAISDGTNEIMCPTDLANRLFPSENKAHTYALDTMDIEFNCEIEYAIDGRPI